MADEKKYSARDAAIAVLQKTEELLKKSELMKRGHEKVEGLRNPESEHEKGVHPSSSAVIAAHRYGGKALWADKGASATRFNSKDVKKQVHKEKLQELKDMPKPNLAKKENPDKDQDAKLGEDVEHLCEEHMLNNIEAERKEGHKIVQKSECMKCMTKKETGHEKGVRTQVNSPSFKNGTSHAGANIRPEGIGGKAAKEEAKRQSKENLQELKSMPKPNLTKKEAPGQNEIGTNAAQEKGRVFQKSEFAELQEDLSKMEEMMKSRGGLRGKEQASMERMIHTVGQKGVRTSLPASKEDIGDFPTTPNKEFRKEHEKVREESKSIKPNLPKSEEAQGMAKKETGHEKGINTQSDPSQRSRTMMGTSKAGSQMPTKSKLDNAEAKEEHGKVLKEMRAQPKPNLPKTEEASVPAPTKVREQAAPQDNPHEAAEGNNNPPGTVPSAVPGHGVMKLHHFVGFVKGKRSQKNKGTL